MVSSFVGRVSSLGAGITRAVRDLNADQQGQPFRGIGDHYAVLDAYYDNEAFDLYNEIFARAKARYGYYRHIRAIRNPTRRAVDWYPGHIYPGAFTPDGLPLPDGTPSCVPFATGTDPRLRLAFSQGLAWANWGSERWAVVRSLAMLGDAFAEVHVDYERRKVYPRWHHPRYITDLEWNGSGDVVAFTIEIPQLEPDGRTAYRWGKVVTKETITTLYNGKPRGYDGQPETIANPWGFVPAVWAQFRNVGGQHGAAVIDGVRPKIDELNNALSSIHDYIAKFAAQGVVLKTDKKVTDLIAIGVNGATADMANPQAGRQEIRYLKGPKELDIDRLLQNLGLAEAAPYIDGLMADIEKDLPESTIDAEVRKLGEIAGVALRMMFGDVEARRREVEGNCDAMLIKLCQMTTAIGGELLRTGQWGLGSELTDQQRRFAPFDLTSYDRGRLAVTFLPRPLFPDAPRDLAANAAAREALKTIQGLREAGYSDEQIFGAGQVPEVIPGLLEQRERASTSAADAFGRAFAAGSV